jgi:anhydro-N-acetylmuramic acid kinase
MGATGLGLDMQVQPVLSLRQPYARELRELIRKTAAGGGVEGKQVGLVHRLLGETFAALARQVADRASLSLQQVQCIGCPGHTIWHEPEGRFPTTFALGLAAVVAERTGVTTVSDFAERDIAVGGRGTHVSAIADYLLLRDPDEARVLVHLGGLARIVYLPAACRIQDILGFEAGPCNLLLDGLMRALTGGREEFDQGGKHGVQGHCQEKLLEGWLSHPYLQSKGPRSVPRHNFADELIHQALQAARDSSCSMHDLLCTATHFVASLVANAIRKVVPENLGTCRILLSGGGVRNGLLWRLLALKLADWSLEKTDAHGVPAEGRKALGFAILAALTIDGVPANLPRVTGAAGARVLGSLTPGSSTNWARCLDWMAAQTAALAVEAD